jgi:hypothetical protein
MAAANPPAKLSRLWRALACTRYIYYWTAEMETNKRKSDINEQLGFNAAIQPVDPRVRLPSRVLAHTFMHHRQVILKNTDPTGSRKGVRALGKNRKNNTREGS